jgi:hypothetical protein
MLFAGNLENLIDSFLLAKLVVLLEDASTVLVLSVVTMVSSPPSSLLCDDPCTTTTNTTTLEREQLVVDTVLAKGRRNCEATPCSYCTALSAVFGMGLVFAPVPSSGATHSRVCHLPFLRHRNKEKRRQGLLP